MNQTNRGPANSPKSIHPAVEAVLLKNHREFLRFLVRRLGDTDTAEEVLQQFYLRVISRSSELRKTESVVSWVYTVLRTTLIDHYRRETARRRRESDYALVQTLAEERWNAETERKTCTCVNKVLPTLKPEYSDALRRINLFGSPPRKVAGDLGIAANAMRVRLHRARRAMRLALLASCKDCNEHDCRICEQVRHQTAAGYVDQLRPDAA